MTTKAHTYLLSVKKLSHSIHIACFSQEPLAMVICIYNDAGIKWLVTQEQREQLGAACQSQFCLNNHLKYTNQSKMTKPAITLHV